PRSWKGADEARARALQSSAPCRSASSCARRCTRAKPSRPGFPKNPSCCTLSPLRASFRKGHGSLNKLASFYQRLCPFFVPKKGGPDSHPPLVLRHFVTTELARHRKSLCDDEIRDGHPGRLERDFLEFRLLLK